MKIATLLQHRLARFAGLIIAVVVLLWIVRGVWGMFTDDEPTLVRPVKTLVVQSHAATMARTFPGKVYAAQEATLSFPEAGILQQLPVKEGDDVAQGALIAKIDDEKQYDRLKETRAKYKRAYSEFQRMAELLKNGYVSQSEYDAKESQMKVSEANFNTAKRNYKDATLLAPFAGVVARKYVDNFERVKSKQPIIKLHYIDTLEVHIDVPENIIILLKEDRKHEVFAHFENLPDKVFPLTLKEFASEADETTQTFRTTFTMMRPQQLTILPGMSVKVTAQLPDFSFSGKPFFPVPVSAVFVDEHKQSFVWRVAPETLTVHKQAVTVSRLSDDKIHILEGVAAGDRIVIAGVRFLHEGQQVKLAEPISDSEPVEASP